MTVAARHQDEIELDLLKSVMRNLWTVPLLYPAVCGVIALTLPSQFSPKIILLWWLATSALQIEYTFYQRRFFDTATADTARWANASATRYVVMNVLWVAMLPLFWKQGNDVQNLGLILIQVIHALLSSILAAPSRKAMFACSLPVVFAAVLGVLWNGTPTFQMLGAAFFLTYLFLIRMANQTRHSIKTEYNLRLHNQNLITDLAAARDISEAARLRTEEANAELMRREERFRALVDNAFDGIIVTDADEVITYASPSVRSIGMRPEDMMGRQVYSFLPPDEIERVKAVLQKNSGHTPRGEHLEFHTTRTGGKVVWFEASVSDLRTNPNVGGYVLNMRDITDRKRGQTEITNQFRVLEALASGAPINEVMMLAAVGAEESNPTANVAIFLVDDALNLTVCASPSFPEHFGDAISTFWDNNKTAAFGQAVTGNEGLLVLPDLLEFTDQPDTIEFAKTYGVRALWMQNFRAADLKGGSGSIAVYMKEPCRPSEWEKSYLLGTAQLASIAINRRRAEENLRAATQTAELANRAKTKFLANMSHELRTPLNAIIGFSDIMKSELFGELGSPRYSEYAKDINDSGAHLLNVIDDILDISKIEAGRYPLEESNIELGEVMRWSIEIVRPRTAEKKITVTLDVSDNLPLVHADMRAIRQIMLNLLSNAAKFTPEGGLIAVAAHHNADGTLTLSVTDNGIGIPPDKLEIVLEPFGQVDDSSARLHSGTGLGLSITKSLAELHDGTFGLESVFGESTTARMTLPAGRLRTPKATTDAMKKSAANQA